MPQPLRPNHVANIRFPLILLAMIAINALLTWRLASPYRLFPSDGLGYYEDLQQLDATLLPLGQRHNPVFWLYLKFCYQVWQQVSTLGKDVFVLTGLCANTLTFLALAVITRQVAGSLGWAIMTGTLHLTSAWTNSY